MKRVFQRAASAVASVICLAICASIACADVKIKSKSTQSGSGSEQITYIKGRRQRMEMAGGMMISITQCDLQRSLQINPQSKTYIVSPFNQPTESADRSPNQPTAKKGAAVRGGVITMTVTSKDTGERKQIFGYTARRFITTMVTESSPEACAKIKTKMEIDAWYIDATFALDCDMSHGYQNYGSGDQSGCQDRYDVKQIGQAAKGYPVWTKTTMFDESGKVSFAVEQEVTEISQTPLDASLFEAPAGYREVKNFSELTSSAAGEYGARPTEDNSGMSANVKNLAGQQSGQASSEVGPKKEGVIRLGLAAVKTSSVDERINAAELAAAVQNTLAQYLKSLNVEVVLIETRSPAQVDAEAKQKECDFVIYTNVEHKKGGGAFGKFAPALSGVATLGGYSGSTAGAVAGEAASASITAAEVSSNVKAKDQLTLDIKMQAPASGVAAVTRQFKAKAQSNGEDIISPLAQQAAQVILIEAAKK